MSRRDTGKMEDEERPLYYDSVEPSRAAPGQWSSGDTPDLNTYDEPDRPAANVQYEEPRPMEPTPALPATYNSRPQEPTPLQSYAPNPSGPSPVPVPPNGNQAGPEPAPSPQHHHHGHHVLRKVKDWAVKKIRRGSSMAD